MNSMLRRTRVRLLAGVSGAVALSVLAVAGCSSSSSSSTSTAAPASSSTSPAAAASSSSSAAPVPLVVYSAQGYDSAMTKAFTKAAGIPVQLDDNSTGPLLTQIEASANNPKWGLLWVDGDTAFAGLDTQGLLLKGWEPSVTWNSLGSSVVPKDQSYAPTGVTLMGILAYNKQKVASPPTTWQALESAAWKGQVVPGLGRLTGVFARHRAERGDSVGLRLDPEGCHLFRATDKPGESDALSPAPVLTA
jgi:iron(III) transport system substrate-binding protein